MLVHAVKSLQRMPTDCEVLQSILVCLLLCDVAMFHFGLGQLAQSDVLIRGGDVATQCGKVHGHGAGGVLVDTPVIDSQLRPRRDVLTDYGLGAMHQYSLSGNLCDCRLFCQRFLAAARFNLRRSVGLT